MKKVVEVIVISALGVSNVFMAHNVNVVQNKIETVETEYITSTTDEEYKNDITNLKETASSLKQEIETLNVLASELKNSVETLSSKTDSNLTKINSFNNKLNTNTTQLNTYINKLSALETNVNTYTNKVSTLENQINSQNDDVVGKWEYTRYTSPGIKTTSIFEFLEDGTYTVGGQTHESYFYKNNVMNFTHVPAIYFIKDDVLTIQYACNSLSSRCVVHMTKYKEN